MIGIVNYGSGNIAAIGNIYKQLKIPYAVLSRPEELAQADRFVMPGVGAFDATMEHIEESGLRAALDEQVLGLKKKVLGICVGMQILAEASDEGTRKGLGWIPGRVRRLPVIAGGEAAKLPLPHMGWNSVRVRRESPLFRDVDLERGFYFLHNYYYEAAHAEDLLATADYGGEVPCSVARDNVFGMQFHPEKSHSNGRAVFLNFAQV